MLPVAGPSCRLIAGLQIDSAAAQVTEVSDRACSSDLSLSAVNPAKHLMTEEE